MAANGVLVFVAHPDDEVVFFGRMIADEVAAHRRVDVLCATGVFDPPALTGTRCAEFRRACWMLGARAEMLTVADASEPLPMKRLLAALQRIDDARSYECVYTHGVWGEYGHQHHRDVCVAAHRVFGARVFSLAGPFPPERRRVLTDAEWLRKQCVASTYYSQPFAAGWCTREEALVKLAPDSVESLYAIGNCDTPWAVPGHASRSVREAIRTSLAAFDRQLGFPEVECIPQHVWAPAHRRFSTALAEHERGAAVPRAH